MPTTPAGFGRALNFGQAGFPTWAKGGRVFPNALAWSDVYQVSVIEVIPDPVYGAPFITGASEIIDSLALQSELIERITGKGRIKDIISERSVLITTVTGKSEIDEDA